MLCVHRSYRVMYLLSFLAVSYISQTPDSHQIVFNGLLFFPPSFRYGYDSKGLYLSQDSLNLEV